APNCDARNVVPDLLELLSEHQDEDEGSLSRRRLLYLRMCECQKPNQLAGAGLPVSDQALELLRNDARRNTQRQGHYVTVNSLSKESAWTALLYRGDPIVLSSTFFSNAVSQEESGYIRGELMEQLASFYWAPLPREVISLI